MSDKTTLQSVWMDGVEGFGSRRNDILLARAVSGQCTPQLASMGGTVVIYLPGDVSEKASLMESSPLREHRAQSIEAHALTLATKFPGQLVVAIRPSGRVRDEPLLCRYDNFCLLDDHGCAIKSSRAHATEHLSALLVSLFGASIEKILSACRLRFCFFSKGGIVFNQLVHELHPGQVASKSDIQAESKVSASWQAHPLWSSIKAVDLLDVGNGGQHGAFPSDTLSIHQLAKCTPKDFQVKIVGTPYQWRSEIKPWIPAERDAYVKLLRSVSLTVTVQTLFEKEHSSLENHFRVLDQFPP